MCPTTQPKYNQYDNPYASPAPTHDLSVCVECSGPTGRSGESFLKPLCSTCNAMQWYAYVGYPEEESND